MAYYSSSGSSNRIPPAAFAISEEVLLRADPKKQTLFARIIDRRRSESEWTYKLETRDGKPVESEAWISECSLNGIAESSSHTASAIGPTVSKPRHYTKRPQRIEDLNASASNKIRRDSSDTKKLQSNKSTKPGLSSYMLTSSEQQKLLNEMIEENAVNYITNYWQVDEEPTASVHSQLEFGHSSMHDPPLKSEEQDDNQRSVSSIFTNDPPVKLSLNKVQYIISAFIDDLCQDLGLLVDDAEKADRMSASLPYLLDMFTLRLEREPVPGAQSDVIELIWQHRDRIAEKFLENQNTLRNSEDLVVSELPEGPLLTDMNMPPFGKMVQQYTVRGSRSMAETLSIEASLSEAQLRLKYKIARSFLLHSPAYQWLLDNIRSSVLLTEGKAIALDTITREITEAFSSSRTPGSRMTKIFRVSFRINWDLVGFLRAQEYDPALETAFECAITITESFSKAQALTCMEYMRQTWPSSGPQTVWALQMALSSPDLTCSTNLFGEVALHIDLRSSPASFEAFGDQLSLIELCEQLAWLGAALRLSPRSSGICSSTPSILASQVPESAGSRSAISVRILFDMSPYSDESVSTDLDSTCWHAMFCNPVVVNGYPILARPENEEGLELSLNMMIDLAEVEFVTPYDEVLILKGFCTMLVPTRREANSITWHFLFNQDGKRIPYHAFRDRCPDWISTDKLNVDLLKTGRLRHFVGWASRITKHLVIKTGTNDMRYSEIDWAGAKKCSAGFAIEQKIGISVSKIVGLSGNVIRGNRDKSTFISQSETDYEVQINEASSMFVVLYDTEAGRGWLVDGASALLHLVRTQVVRDPYMVSSLFNQDEENPIKFKHPELFEEPNAAMNALRDKDNIKHVILRYFHSYADEKIDEPPRGSTFSGGDPSDEMDTSLETEKYSASERRKGIYRRECFRELVSKAWNTLEQIYDSQTEIDTTHVSKQIRNPFEAILEGYEFMAIVSCKHVLTRRSIKLPRNGTAWLDLVRSVGAIALFGKQFGEIYRPVHSVKDVICEHWKTVPQGHGFLAVPVALMKGMEERNRREGEVDMASAKIAEDILWFHSRDSCNICGENCNRPFKRVKRYRSSANNPGSKLPQAAEILSNSLGAVLFGKSSALDMRILKPTTSPTGSAENDFNDSRLASDILDNRTTDSAIESSDVDAGVVSSQRASHNATASRLSLGP
ncbi:MAG: hypothetical protein Q9165_007315 [Trypethelium subeluteriae]